MGISNQTKKNNKMKSIISYLAMPIMGYLYNPDAVNIRRMAENKFDAVDCDRYVGICPRNYRPLCDNNGRIHSNPCTFLTAYCTEDRSLRLQERGSCMLNDNPKIAEPKEAGIENITKLKKKKTVQSYVPESANQCVGQTG